MHALASGGAADKAEHMERLGELAGKRAANAEAIVDSGGVPAILASIEVCAWCLLHLPWPHVLPPCRRSHQHLSLPSVAHAHMPSPQSRVCAACSQDERVEARVVDAGANALGAMARQSTHTAEHIAQSGAVRTVVKRLRLPTQGDAAGAEAPPRAPAEAASSVRLLGELSRAERNAPLVVREGGLTALTEELRRATASNQPAQEAAAAAPAEALSHLSRNPRVAKHIAREHQV